DASMLEYKYDGKLLKTQHILEEYKIRGKKSVFETIIHTHFGPVFMSENAKSARNPKGFAMKWIGHTPGNIILAFDKINRSKNYNDFLEGISTLDNPGLNIGFASYNGDIAMHVAGSYPARWKEQGRFIL